MFKLPQVASALAVSLLIAMPLSAQFQSLPGAPLTSGAPIDMAPICGTPDIDPILARAVEQSLANVPEREFTDGELKIPVAVHLITAGKKGKFTREIVDIMIGNLNWAFDGSGISFYLSKLDYLNSRKIYESCGLGTANEKVMKKKLSYLPARVLNIYSCKPTGRGLPVNMIGFAYFPWMWPENSYMQGVVVHPGTLPSGGGIPNYDYYGLNAVHETGHWLGLYHTFQDGCLDGDEVFDTPAQDSPSFSCEIGRDSCPAGAGLDDIQNFMNYVDDFCYDHFTAQQAARMRLVALSYRPSLF
jgi:hypothetical protein